LVCRKSIYPNVLLFFILLPFELGNRNGVAIIFGVKIHGFIAWLLWRTFYLSNLPTANKKLKVMTDWTMDLIFKPDVARIKETIKFVRN